MDEFSRVLGSVTERRLTYDELTDKMALNAQVLLNFAVQEEGVLEALLLGAVHFGYGTDSGIAGSVDQGGEAGILRVA